jgi:hypothetical protein
MNYVGVDIHKKYSVLCALDEGGRKLREARVEGNASRGFVGGQSHLFTLRFIKGIQKALRAYY